MIDIPLSLNKLRAQLFLKLSYISTTSGLHFFDQMAPGTQDAYV
jgi:hypothetical protein